MTFSQRGKLHMYLTDAYAQYLLPYGPTRGRLQHLQHINWSFAGIQQAFCKAHLSNMGSEVTAAVFGPDRPASLFPWDVVPATVWELPHVQMIAYKPGAGQLRAWWSTPYRYVRHGCFS